MLCMAGQLMVVSASSTAALRNLVGSTSHSSKVVPQQSSQPPGDPAAMAGSPEVKAGWLAPLGG